MWAIQFAPIGLARNIHIVIDSPLEHSFLHTRATRPHQNSRWRQGDLFDVASMQFALHYMGQTEARMRRFMHEVSRHLRIGGIFIATTMDSRVLIQLLMGQAEQSWVSGHVVLWLHRGQRRTFVDRMGVLSMSTNSRHTVEIHS